MRRTMRVLLLAVASGLVLAAGVVGCPAAHDEYPGKACKTDNDCYQGETCVNLECTPPVPDMAMDTALPYDFKLPPTDANDVDMAEVDL